MLLFLTLFPFKIQYSVIANIVLIDFFNHTVGINNGDINVTSNILDIDN